MSGQIRVFWLGFVWLVVWLVFSLLYSGKVRRKWRAGLCMSEANVSLEEPRSQDLDTREVISSKPFSFYIS